jgi:hypothetical protein
VRDVCVLAQRGAIFEDEVEGFGEVEPMGYDGLCELWQQLICVDGGKPRGVKRKSVFYPQAIENLVSNMHS